MIIIGFKADYLPPGAVGVFFFGGASSVKIPGGHTRPPPAGTSISTMYSPASVWVVTT